MDSSETVLKELLDVSLALVKEGQVAEAVTAAVKTLQLEKRLRGAGSYEFQRMRVEVAGMILNAAKLHQSHGRKNEAAELLAFVDNFTTEPLNFPELDRRRLLFRTHMLKELMIARQQQGRFRSALTFGKHLVTICNKLLLYNELPVAHLNVASVLSSMKSHDEALSHCYTAYQVTSAIIRALSDGGEQIIKSTLQLAQQESEISPKEALDRYENCLLMIQREGDPLEKGVLEEAQAPPVFSVAGDPTLQSSLSHLFWSVEQDTKRVPCLSLLLQMQELSHSRSASQRQSEEQRYWGGVLALCFRSIAVEQEHLNQFSSALLTYRVAVATAEQCLGEIHPVTVQCGSALKDALDAQTHRERNKPDALKRIARRTLPRPASVPLHTNHASSRAEKSPQSRRKLSRPDWNPWFNSTVILSADTTADRYETHSAPVQVSAPRVKPVLTTSTSSRAETPAPKEATRATAPIVNAAALPEITPADFAFLSQTFRLRHDINFARPTSKGRPVRDELKALKAERRLAEALASELGEK